jgi:hypothetical protein
LVGKSEGKRALGRTGVGVNGGMILKRTFRKWNTKAWAELLWLGIRESGGLL